MFGAASPGDVISGRMWYGQVRRGAARIYLEARVRLSQVLHGDARFGGAGRGYFGTGEVRL